jgi:diketogulonate reductase-like aldo/keto reductase
MIKNLKSTTTLNNGVKMPWFGIGVFKVAKSRPSSRA